MELVKIVNGNAVTTSRLVSDKFDKRHSDILRVINNLDCSPDFTERNFALSEYIDTTGRRLPEYIITRDGFTFLVMGFTGVMAAKLKEDYINEFNRMEAGLKKQLSRIEILQMALDSEKRAIEAEKSLAITRQENELKQMRIVNQNLQLRQSAPKVEYYEDVLSSKSTYTTTQVAKEFGMSAPGLNRLLNSMKIQYKQNGQWLLFHRFQDQGYTSSNTYTYTNDRGDSHTSQLTVWTEKGREFIHKVIQKNRNES